MKSNEGLKYPDYRWSIIIELKYLSDLKFQQVVWCNAELPHLFSDKLEATIESFEDLRFFDEEYDRTKLIGTTLRNQHEVDLIIPLVESLDKVIDTIGWNKPDEIYLNSSEWGKVIKRAKDAYKIIGQDKLVDDNGNIININDIIKIQLEKALKKIL